MSITSSLNLSIVSSDGAASLTKSVTGLSFTGTNEMYIQPQTIGTSSFVVPLPQSPAQLVYVRNLAPAALAAPAAPTLSQSSGGALSAATYYAQISYVNAFGETVASAEASLAVSANNVLTVSSPANVTGATGWNVYVGSTSGTETKQNTSPLAIGTNWTEPTSGLITGAALPSSNSTASVVTVTWTPQGGTSAKSLDLVPQAALLFCEPTASSGFTAPSGVGGITALSLSATAAGTPIEAFIGG